MDNFLSIQTDTKTKLLDRVNEHKEQFKRMFKARYLEMLPSLIKYKNSEATSIDFLKVEVALRGGYDLAVGLTKNNNLQVLGIVKGKQTDSNPHHLFPSVSLTHEAIDFIIPKHLRLDTMKEISHYDNCETGDFVVLRNKSLNYAFDYEILDFYVDELAEIVLSRYSLIMQAKINTIFIGDSGDETIVELVSQIYNGAPYITVTDLFDPEEQIYTFNNGNIAQNFVELKREYQNKIAELNNMLGMNALAVEKESGVSDTEANSNRAYSTTNANIYLDARNQGLEKLNKRFPEMQLNLEAVYNDEVASEFAEVAYSGEAEGAENENDNPI